MGQSAFIYTRADGHGGFLERPRCLMISTPEKVVGSLVYYRTEAGYTDAFVTTQTFCDTCNGSGTVAKKRPKFARKTCPTCKGVEAPEEVYFDPFESSR